MFRLTSIECLTRAIELARASRLVVRRTSIARMYRVENLDNGKIYVVNFFVRKADHARFAHCICPATIICKHIASAAALNVYDATVRRAAAMVEQMPETA